MTLVHMSDIRSDIVPLHVLFEVLFDCGLMPFPLAKIDALHEKLMDLRRTSTHAFWHDKIGQDCATVAESAQMTNFTLTVHRARRTRMLSSPPNERSSMGW